MTNKHTPEPFLSIGAAETMIGMVEFCINHGACMGMDEGRDEDDNPHPFVQELMNLSKNETANARLLAASADMLEALELADKALSLLDQDKFGALRMFVRGAIRKAKKGKDDDK